MFFPAEDEALQPHQGITGQWQSDLQPHSHQLMTLLRDARW